MSQFFLGEVFSDGNYDAQFGGQGSRSPARRRPGSSDVGVGVSPLANGEFLEVGEVTLQNGTSEIGLKRFLAAGVLDQTFGNAGTILIPGFASQILTQPDGKILVSGTADLGAGPQFSLVRINPNGTLDTNFGTGGTVFGPAGSGVGGRLALLASGEIVQAGGTGSDSLVLYAANGQQDSSFGSGGLVHVGLERVGIDDRSRGQDSRGGTRSRFHLRRRPDQPRRLLRYNVRSQRHHHGRQPRDIGRRGHCDSRRRLR